VTTIDGAVALSPVGRCWFLHRTLGDAQSYCNPSAPSLRFDTSPLRVSLQGTTKVALQYLVTPP